MSNIFYKTIITGLALGLIFATPALAGDISISDQVAHVGQDDEHGDRIEIFMNIENAGAADRIYAVRSKVAKSGQMSGRTDRRAGGQGDHLIASVIDIPAKGRVELTEEGRHVMLVGLKKKVVDGEIIQITLFFEKAGRIKLDVPIESDTH